MLDRPQYSQHISAKFNAELDRLKQSVLEMGGLVEKQIDLALAALTEGDSGDADEAIAADHLINELEMSIDEQCVRIFALRQPAASDLRLLIATNKLTTDIERIGDEASAIAELARELASEPSLFTSGDSPKAIAAEVTLLLQRALDAFARLDDEAAVGVILGTRKVSALHKAVQQRLIDRMQAQPKCIAQLLKLIWIFKSFKRISDHVANIGEQVVYLVQGKDIRHQKTETVSQLLD
jgi:phosphate transport system protein